MNKADNSPDDNPNKKKFDPVGLEAIELTVSHLFTTKVITPPSKEAEPKKSTWLEYLKLKIDNFAKRFTNIWRMEPTVNENRDKRDFKMFITAKNRHENPMNNSLQKDNNLNQSIVLKRRKEPVSSKKPSFLNVLNYYRTNVFQNMQGKVNLDQAIKVWTDICEIKATPQYPHAAKENNYPEEFEEALNPKATPVFVELDNGKRAMNIEDNSQQAMNLKMLKSSKLLFKKMQRSHKKSKLGKMGKSNRTTTAATKV